MKNYKFERWFSITLFLCSICAWADVTVKDVSVKPRWPWNGLVDVTYSIVCKETDDDGKLKDVYVDFTAIDGDRGQEIPMRTLTGDGAKDPVKDGGPYTVTWDASKDAPTLNSSELKVQIHAIAGGAPYLVIDLLTWKKHYTSQPPDLNDDTCRTTELWLRQVKPGTFKMGHANGNDNEKPVHEVTITKMFYIGVFECTQKQWELVMKGTNRETPSYFKGSTRPVEYVTYNEIRGTKWPADEYDGCDSSAFMGRLRAKLDNKLAFDLPTEAQWEFAARGGNESKGYTYSGSNNIGDVAWYGERWSSAHHVVGKKNPNELGLYDMSGNVWEWCLDWYDSNYYGSSPKDNPVGPTNTGSYRVKRGGHWNNGGYYCGSADRYYGNPSYADDGSGFRVVCLPLVR